MSKQGHTQNKRAGTSVKQRLFASEPMGNKPVSKLPGIGEKAEATLKRQGYGQASRVYGQYLMMNRDKEQFTEWLTRNGNTTRNRAEATAQCFDHYSENFM